jgi:CheY-like chemotaxis protein
MKLAESTILILDDDEEIIIQAKRILENVGATVLSAYDVPSAMGMLKVKTPHLIITDLQMSPQNGFYFLTEVKKDPKITLIPVMVLSAQNSKEAVYTAISLGACDYVIKPLKTTQLIRKIQRILKDQDFLKVDFKNEPPPTVNISVTGSFQSMGDIGIRIESGICFNPIKHVTINCENPKLTDLEKIIFSNHNKSVPTLKGMFNSEFIAIPIGPEFLNLKTRC